MTESKSQTELIAEIASKLDIVLAFLAARGMEGNTGAIMTRLESMGYDSKVIAPVVGLTENATRVRLQRLKKKKASGKKSGGKS